MRTFIRAAGLLIIDQAVLLENPLGTELWYLPGGRLEDGETLEIALRREFREEFDVAVTTGALVFVVENFFPLADDVIREYGFYFRIQAEDRRLAPTAPIPSRETDQFRHAWIDLERLPSLSFKPAVLVSHLFDLPQSTLFLKARDGGLKLHM
ncbi:MAG: NUDIX domain-containing protein [Proteobacteria bacterium]|nr:NUDIX domain-containing protein [Pseudomonadota bacterium]MBI3496295.1 NUDIX domain-containing protein [Pseudomonadota bacterium]